MPFAELPVSIVVVGPEQDRRHYVTISPLDTQRDIAPAKIIGMLKQPIQRDESITPDNFARNGVFVDFLHSIIARHGPTVPGLVRAAKQQEEGWVYIIDGRTPTPQEDVPQEDIIGSFQVINGEISSASYKRNTEHRILSDRGFFRIDALLIQQLINELAKI
jgi:hypothetical protein